MRRTAIVDFYALFSFVFKITNIWTGVSTDEIFVKKRKEAT